MSIAAIPAAGVAVRAVDSAWGRCFDRRRDRRSHGGVLLVIGAGATLFNSWQIARLARRDGIDQRTVATLLADRTRKPRTSLRRPDRASLSLTGPPASNCGIRGTLSYLVNAGSQERRLPPMRRPEQPIVVLVASPSDLEPERNRLEEVVRELNLSWSHSLGVRLELVRWETHGYPGVGNDPQDVLNRELPDDPDIFIGMMWSRFGTATGRAGSGTEEEFNRALQRYRHDPDSVRIMFYFKDAPLAPSDIDPDQLRRVARFRESLGVEGALYWTFRTLDDFVQLLRIHLSRQLQELSAPVRSQRTAAPQQISQSTATESDELGLLDFLDLVDDYFGELREITRRITAETELIGEKMQRRTAEMEEAAARAHGQLSRRDIRNLVERAAADMMQFVARIEVELPLFRNTLQKGADAAAQAVLISATLDSNDRGSASEARQKLIGFRDSLIHAHNGIDSFKNSVQNLPRMTTILNAAKRETARVLQDQLDSMAEGRRIVTETIRSLDAILGNGPTESR